MQKLLNHIVYTEKFKESTDFINNEEVWLEMAAQLALACKQAKLDEPIIGPIKGSYNLIRVVDSDESPFNEIFLLKFNCIEGKLALLTAFDLPNRLLVLLLCGDITADTNWVSSNIGKAQQILEDYFKK